MALSGTCMSGFMTMDGDTINDWVLGTELTVWSHLDTIA